MPRLKTPVSNPKKNFPAAKWLPDNGLVARLRAGAHYDDANWKDKTKIVRLPTVAHKDDVNWKDKTKIVRLPAVAHKDGVVWGNKNIEWVAASPQPTQYQLFIKPTSLRPSVASGATPY